MSPPGGENPVVDKWRALHDDDGTPIGRYLHASEEGREVAARVELAVPVERAVPVILRELRGMRVAGPVELGRALVAAGGQARRHAHVYSHALETVPEEPRGLAPLDRRAEDLLPAYDAAFPPGHPDRSAAALRHLSGIVAGRLGPLLDASGIALDGDRVVAAILIAELGDAEPPLGGPWVMEVFRDPRYPGTGRALLERALARVKGPALGLTVTEGNPAVRLYERLGFRRVLTSLTVELVRGR